MTQDPKKLPNWLRGKKKKEDAPSPQQETPPTPPSPAPQASAPSTPSAPSDDAALPPWLRNEPPPPPPTPSKVRRLAPPAPEQPGGVPPWLAGIEEEPKSYKIGGTELSEEYLKAGDELPETLDSEMTFDSWMADQLESKREKDIEEEVPDLLSSITPDDANVRPEGKQTGQLPDWFLGLEELDTTDAPDWFGGDDASSKPAAANEMPPWINDMIDDQPEPEPIDEIGSFFDSLGGNAPVQEEDPEIDWFNQPEPDEADERDEQDEQDDSNIPGVPTDDFFTQLVSGGRSTPPAPRAPEPPARPPMRPSSEVNPPPRPQIELPDIDDDFIEDEPPPPAVVIPQNELDAFFDNVAAVRSAPSVDDFEDPDLEWIVPSEPVAEEPPPEPEPEPEPPSAAQSEDTMSWLNQLQNIVSSASRPAETPQEEVVSFGTKDSWDAPSEEAKNEADDFAWPETSYVEAAPPAKEETQETEWFSSITPADAEAAEAAEPTRSEAPPPAPGARSSLLSGRLGRAAEPPPAPIPAEPEMDDLPDLFGESYPTDQVGEEPLIPEHELQSGWLTDDLFSENAPAGTVETAASDDDDFFSQLQSHSDASVLEDSSSQPDNDTWNAANNPLADTDFLNSLGFEQASAAQGESTGSWDTPSTGAAEPLEDDFFTSLGIDQAPADAEEDALGQWSAQQSAAEPLEDDFFTSLGIDQPSTAGSQDETSGQWNDATQNEAETPQEDDFFGSLSINDADQEAPAAPQADMYDPWTNASQSEAETPQEDDFFSSLGIDEQPSASEEDLTGQWGAQANAEPLGDDFFTSLGSSEADEEAPAASQAPQYEDWGVQQSEAERREADFYNLLSMSDEDQATASTDDLFGQWDAEVDESELSDDDGLLTAPSSEFPAEPEAAVPAQADEPDMPSDDDLYGLFGTDDADQEQPAASQSEPQEDDFFATLSSAAPVASEDEIPDQWGAQANNEELPQEDDFFASLSSTPPAASEEDALGEWGTQASDEEAQQPDDPYATRNVKSDLESRIAASEEDLFGQWGTQPNEAALQEDDFFARLGLNDEDDTEPSADGEQLGQWQADAAPQSDDFFAQLGSDDEGEPATNSEDDPFGWNSAPLDEAPPEQAPQEDTFLASLGFKDDQNAALPASDDMFAQFDDQAKAAVPLDDNFFASLNPDQPAKTEQDAYQWDTQAEMPPADDFFSAIGLLSEADVPVEAPPERDRQEAPPEEDFFTSLGMLSDDQSATQPMPGRKNEPQTYGDVDSYLASLNVGEPDITPTTDDLFSGSDSMDIDALFSQPVMKDRPKVEAAEGDTLAGANEDWLNQLQASVGEVSASAIVRQKEDRPVEELSDRLKKLRAKAEQIPDEAPAAPQSDALTDMLPSGTSALSSSPFIDVAPGLVGSIALTSEQQTRVELLKALVPADTRGESHISAIDATYDSPFMADLEDSEESVVVPTKKEEAPARPRTRRRTRQRIRLDRVLIAALIALAVIVPFTIRGFRVGDLPPSSFAAGSSEETAFSQINGLKAGDLVLIGLEYGPTSAAELDGMATALLRNILMKAAYPVIISGDPLTILRAQDLMASINADSAFLTRIGASQPLAANSDYYIIRYLPGSVIGLRAFSQNTANLILTDVQGQATNLVVHSLQNFALVTVVTDSAETMRGYAEQIAPLTRAPLVSAVSYGAAPLAEPYTHALGGGLLVGYRDAYTYTDLLDSVSARSIAQHSLRIIPTEPPPEAAQPGENGAPSAQATAEATSAANAPSIGTATVISRQSVNMRSGAGTTNPVIAAVPSGSTLSVLGVSPDGAWVHVVLDNGQDGWISAALLSLDVKKASKIQPHSQPKRQPVNPDLPTRTRVPQATATPAPTKEAPTAGASAETTAEATVGAGAEITQAVVPSTATPQATPTATATPSPEPTVEVVAAVPLPPPSPGYRDERWYAMNLGIIASTLIITFGAVVNILRGLLRRGRSS